MQTYFWLVISDYHSLFFATVLSSIKMSSGIFDDAELIFATIVRQEFSLTNSEGHTNLRISYGVLEYFKTVSGNLRIS